MTSGRLKLLLFLSVSLPWSVSSAAHQICGVILDFRPGIKIIVSGEYIFHLTPETKRGPEEAVEYRQRLIESLHAAERVCLEGIFPARRLFMPTEIRSRE